jgi:hypothetical protein
MRDAATSGARDRRVCGAFHGKTAPRRIKSRHRPFRPRSKSPKIGTLLFGMMDIEERRSRFNRGI